MAGNDIKQTINDIVKIGLLLYQDCMPAGLLAFSDLLVAANVRAGQTLFKPTWLSEPGGPFECANGQTFKTDTLGRERIDGLLVPGAWRDQTSVQQDADGSLVRAIAALDRKVLLLSYCTGVHLVAQTGKLDHQPATTTWWLRNAVRDRFPAVQWQLNNTSVINEKTATASGVNGYLPIGLALINRLAGDQIAADIRKYMVLPRPIEQNTPFQELPLLLQQGQLMRRIVQWVEKTPATELRINRLAEHLNLTSRTLARRLAQVTDQNTAQLVRLIKLNQVSDQLIGTHKAIQTISNELGFSDDTSLRRSFRKLTGMTPGEYRRQFG